MQNGGAWSRSFSRRETVAGSCVWNLARPQKAPARKLRTLQATGLKLASFLQVLTCRLSYQGCSRRYGLLSPIWTSSSGSACFLRLASVGKPREALRGCPAAHPGAARLEDPSHCRPIQCDT